MNVSSNSSTFSDPPRSVLMKTVIAAYVKEKQVKSYTLWLWEHKNKYIFFDRNNKRTLTSLFIHSVADFTLWLMLWLLLVIVEAHLTSYAWTKVQLTTWWASFHTVPSKVWQQGGFSFKRSLLPSNVFFKLPNSCFILTFLLSYYVRVNNKGHLLTLNMSGNEHSLQVLHATDSQFAPQSLSKSYGKPLILGTDPCYTLFSFTVQLNYAVIIIKQIWPICY